MQKFQHFLQKNANNNKRKVLILCASQKIDRKIDAKQKPSILQSKENFSIKKKENPVFKSR